MMDYNMEHVNGRMVGTLFKIGIVSPDKKGVVSLYIGVSYLAALGMISERCYAELLFVITPLLKYCEKSIPSCSFHKFWKENDFGEWIIQILNGDYEKRGIRFADRKCFEEFLFSVSYVTVPRVNEFLLQDGFPSDSEDRQPFIKFYGEHMYFLKKTIHAYDLYEMDIQGKQHAIAKGVSRLNYDLHAREIALEYGAELTDCYGVYDLVKEDRKVKNVLQQYPYRKPESVWSRLSDELISSLDLYRSLMYAKSNENDVRVHVTFLHKDPALDSRRRIQIVNYMMEPKNLSLVEIKKKLAQVVLFDEYEKSAVLILKEFFGIISILGYQETEDLSVLFATLFETRDLIFGECTDVSVLSACFMRIFLSDIKNRTDIKSVIERGEFSLEYDGSIEKQIEYKWEQYLGWFEYPKDGIFRYERYFLEKGIAEWEYTVAPANVDHYRTGQVKYNRNTRLFLIECEKLSPQLFKQVIEAFGLRCEEDIRIKDQDGERTISSEEFLRNQNEPVYENTEPLPFD